MKTKYFYAPLIFLFCMCSLQVFALKAPVTNVGAKLLEKGKEGEKKGEKNANVSFDPNPTSELVVHPHSIIPKLGEEQSTEANIYLNFESATLSSVLNYLAEQKKINVVPHKDLEAQKVSLTTREPMTLDRAWNVVLTLLEMNGFSIVKVDNLFRVVSNKDNGQHPLPTYSSKNGTEPENLPDSDLVVRYVYFFKNIRPDMAQSILSTMLEESSIRVNDDLQACIIKEKCFNIKAAMKIIKELDMGGLRESIKIIQLNHADATEVEELFGRILEKEGGGGERKIQFSVGQRKEILYFSSTTRIFKDE
ncbi:MAG: hypothetical protein V1855_00545, partial [bacterium]